MIVMPEWLSVVLLILWGAIGFAISVLEYKIPAKFKKLKMLCKLTECLVIGIWMIVILLKLIYRF